jgi:tRNA A37 methylthiotransferase MiaB
VNTAAYSPRPGTPAAHWGDQVADLVKLDRLNRLNRVVNAVAGERAQRFMGRELEVLASCFGSITLHVHGVAGCAQQRRKLCPSPTAGVLDR